MNKSPEFDMLKELEEPGKERVRHLNHRKEKDQPRNQQQFMQKYSYRVSCVRMQTPRNTGRYR